MKRFLPVYFTAAIIISAAYCATSEAKAINQQPEGSASESNTLTTGDEASAAKLSINSTYGDLLDNPVTKAVLVKLAPEVVNNPQSQMGRTLAFKDLAQFEPTLTPDKLKAIDAALAAAQK